MHPKVVMCSHHVGHTEYGKVANPEQKATVPEVGIASADKQDKVEAGLPSNGWSKLVR